MNEHKEKIREKQSARRKKGVKNGMQKIYICRGLHYLHIDKGVSHKIP